MPKGKIINPNYKGWNIYNQNTLFKSKKAYVIDRSKAGKITTDYNKWKNNPRRWDYEGIDTPEHIFKYSNKKKSYSYPTNHKKTYWKKWKKKR